MTERLLPGIVTFCCFLAGCIECLEQGKNGVPDPSSQEFQLVFNNIVSRESDIFVNEKKVGTVCEETEFATVGNFPVSPQTTITIHTLVSGTDCSLSPCCDNNCSAQVCRGTPVIDTTPFAGRIFNTGLIWLW